MASDAMTNAERSSTDARSTHVDPELEALALGLAEAMSSGTVPDGVFANDVFLDLNVPEWRFQLQGLDTLRHMLAADLDPARIETMRLTPGIGGFVLELAVENERYYGRRLYNVRTSGGLIAEVTMFCTGDWSLEQRARQQAEAPMLRPD